MLWDSLSLLVHDHETLRRFADEWLAGFRGEAVDTPAANAGKECSRTMDRPIAKPPMMLLPPSAVSIRHGTFIVFGEPVGHACWAVHPKPGEWWSIRQRGGVWWLNCAEPGLAHRLREPRDEK